ncbi:MAG: hypothetical protein J6T01_06275 [Kiritimatiellae bacterium]|nr:hypothetical protein [Kiritimatiellia bacterium]
MRELKRLLKTKYDFVCSVGSDCGCAGHLVKNRLRRASYPFDWIGDWYIGVAGAAATVAADFAGFLKLENLRRDPNPPRGPQDDLRHDYYHDFTAGFVFAHDFPAGRDAAEVIAEVREKYDRRIKRFYRTVEASPATLLVYWTWRDRPEPEDALKAAETFRAKFPGRRVDLLVMRHTECADIAATAAGDGVFIVDGPFHPEGAHPAFGDVAVNSRVFSLIRLRGKWRDVAVERFERMKTRVVSAFIFDREKRHEYRSRREKPSFI